MIILDPEREGCHVYNGHYMCFIRGNPQQVCEEIRKRVGYIDIIETPQYGVEERYVQNISVRLDTVGIGIAYVNGLTEMGIRFEPMEIKHIDQALPIQTPHDRRTKSYGNILHKSETTTRY